MKTTRLSPSVLGAIVLYILLLFGLCNAEPGHRRGGRSRKRNPDLPDLPSLSNHYRDFRKRAVNGSACIESPPATITAPRENVWIQLTHNETKGLHKWLLQQDDLNLSHGYG